MVAALNALILIFAALWLGNGLQSWYLHSIPGPVLGMLLMLAFLLIRGGALPALNSVAQWFIRYLSLFFIPVTVGIAFLDDQVQQQWLAILLATVPATIVAQLIVASLLRYLLAHTDEHP